MKISKHKQSIYLIPVGIVVTILVIIAIFLAGAFFGPEKPTDNSTEKAKKLYKEIEMIVQKAQCPNPKGESKEEFLEKYTVKRGDTLLSIAKNTIKDPSRVGELIALNKDRYKGLSVQTPFIEQGWVLLLPPKEFIIPPQDFSNIGVLGKENATVVNIDLPLIWTSTGKGQQVMKVDSTTKYVGRNSYQVGDCVTFISLGTHVYLIQPQNLEK